MRRWLAAAVGLVIVITLAVFASRQVIREARANANAETTPKIAVLPFDYVGRIEGKEFADGMTEEVTSRLSSLRGLRVIGRQSVRSYAGSTKTSLQIASELGVKYVLTGSVRWDQSEDGKVLVRVSPALLRPLDSTQIWGESYQTALSEMFDAQVKVATGVTSALNVPLLTSEKQALARRPTENVAAYGAYVRGKSLLENPSSPADVRQAIRNLEQAIALDRKFALAWAFLALAHTEYFWNGGDPTAKRLQMASAALDSAEDLDPRNADLHIARGIFLYHGFRDYENALRELSIAEQSRPNDYNIQSHKAGIERRQGKWGQAATSMKKALELEPRNAAFSLEVARIVRYLGRWPEADSYAERALMLDPGNGDAFLLKAELAVDARGNVPEAIELLRRGIAVMGSQSDAILMLQRATWPAVEDPALRNGLLNARLTQSFQPAEYYFNKLKLFFYLKDDARARAYADTAIKALEPQVKTVRFGAVAAMSIAFAHAIRGEKNEALRAINKSEELLPAEKDAYVANERMNDIPAIYVLLGDHGTAISALEKRVSSTGGLTRNRIRLDPLYAPLRGNPRFERLVQSQ